MDYTKPRKGDPLRIPADLWSAIIDLVQSNQSGSSKPNSRGKQSKQRNADIVTIQNKTGSACDRFSILMIDAPIVLPADNADEFKRCINLKGILPTSDGDGRWCVLLEPLAIDAIGEAVVAGVAICTINVADVADTFVASATGSAVPLSNATGGSAQILWVAGGVGSATATGNQLSIIKLGGGSGGGLPLPTLQGQVLQATSQNQYAWQLPELQAAT